MNVEINWLAVGLSALSTLVVGSLWYAPKAFGSMWEKLARIDKKRRAKPLVTITTALAVSVPMAYVVAHLTYISQDFFQTTFLQAGLSTAFWLWLGIVATRFITHDGFESRPRALTLITLGHELITLMTVGLIIGLLKP